MLWHVLRFELARHLRSLSTWVYFGLFLTTGFLLFVAAAGAFESVSLGMGTGGKVMVNSPYTLASFVAALGQLGLLVVAAVAGQAIEQDFRHGTYPLFFTAPLPVRAYLGGRFCAALLILILIHAAAALGCLLGSLMPFVDAALVGPNRAMAYLQPYLVLVLPNLLLLAAIFFAMGALTRKMRTVWVSAVVLLLGSLVAATLTEKIEEKTLAALLDPFGGHAFERVTEYWTVSEKNGRLVPLAGVLLANRLAWGALALGLLVLTRLRFRMAEPLERARQRVGKESPPPAPLAPTPLHPPRPLGLWARLSWLTFRETVKNVPFLVLVLAGIMFVVLAARVSGALYGTPTHPVTYAMIELGTGGFGLFQLIIVVLYAGELVWREREARIDQIIDALPVPTWVLFGAKLAALMLVGVVLQLVVMACGIGIQLARGYTRFELPLYLTDLLGLKMVAFFQIAALALAVQTLVDNKNLGHFVMVVYFVLNLALPRFGLEHKLYLFGADPGYVYSDMNGFGPFLRPWAWFNLYWSLAALGLALLSNLFFVRGPQSALRLRLREARRRMRGMAGAALLATAVALVATGGFIFYNTNILNEYETANDRRRESADYERQYKKHEREPQPLITAVEVHFDLRPETRVARMSGRYQLKNAGTTPIPKVYLNLSDDVKIHRLAIGTLSAPTTRDDRLAFHTFALPAPLAAGTTTTLEFDLEYAPHGFSNRGATGIVRGNGSFLHNSWLPHVGYAPGAELGDDDERRKRGLGPRPRIADLDDPVARQRNYISADAHWVRFAASACTAPDQVAIFPGRLVRAWTAAGRRCFAYTTDNPVLNFFSVVSARYQVRRDRWRDVDIEIHHHRGHEHNLDRMVRGVKDSLAYFSANFSPYRHKQLRIVEFPRYQSFAQSFPATIPWSEATGFIAKVDPGDEDDIDFPYYITGHEVAHQWWGHEVAGADVQGATLLSESLAQYSALMVMKKTFGPFQMKRFLRYELDRYLQARGMERKREMPLVRVEHQPYIQYNKASLAFYALADAVGEEAVNRALRGLLADWAGKGPPYARSVDLLAQLRKAIPPQGHALLVDLFETITLFENRATSATARQANGMWETTLTFEAKKLRAGELGKETEAPLDDLVDVGLVDDKGVAQHLERLRLLPGVTQAVMRSKVKPVKAGIDPLNKLVDRIPDDNVVAVQVR